MSSSDFSGVSSEPWESSPASCNDKWGCSTSGTCPGKARGQSGDVHMEGMSVDACHFRVGVTTGWGTCLSALPSVGVVRKNKKAEEWR